MRHTVLKPSDPMANVDPVLRVSHRVEGCAADLAGNFYLVIEVEFNFVYFK